MERSYEQFVRRSVGPPAIAKDTVRLGHQKHGRLACASSEEPHVSCNNLPLTQEQYCTQIKFFIKIKYSLYDTEFCETQK